MQQVAAELREVLDEFIQNRKEGQLPRYVRADELAAVQEQLKKQFEEHLDQEVQEAELRGRAAEREDGEAIREQAEQRASLAEARLAAALQDVTSERQTRETAESERERLQESIAQLRRQQSKSEEQRDEELSRLTIALRKAERDAEEFRSRVASVEADLQSQYINSEKITAKLQDSQETNRKAHLEIAALKQQLKQSRAARKWDVQQGSPSLPSASLTGRLEEPKHRSPRGLAVNLPDDQASSSPAPPAGPKTPPGDNPSSPRSAGSPSRAATEALSARTPPRRDLLRPLGAASSSPRGAAAVILEPSGRLGSPGRPEEQGGPAQEGSTAGDEDEVARPAQKRPGSLADSAARFAAAGSRAPGAGEGAPAANSSPVGSREGPREVASPSAGSAGGSSVPSQRSPRGPTSPFGGGAKPGAGAFGGGFGGGSTGSGFGQGFAGTFGSGSVPPREVVHGSLGSGAGASQKPLGTPVKAPPPAVRAPIADIARGDASSAVGGHDLSPAGVREAVEAAESPGSAYSDSFQDDSTSGAFGTVGGVGYGHGTQAGEGNGEQQSGLAGSEAPGAAREVLPSRVMGSMFGPGEGGGNGSQGEAGAGADEEDEVRSESFEEEDDGGGGVVFPGEQPGDPVRGEELSGDLGGGPLGGVGKQPSVVLQGDMADMAAEAEEAGGDSVDGDLDADFDFDAPSEGEEEVPAGIRAGPASGLGLGLGLSEAAGARAGPASEQQAGGVDFDYGDDYGSDFEDDDDEDASASHGDASPQYRTMIGAPAGGPPQRTSAATVGQSTTAGSAVAGGRLPSGGGATGGAQNDSPVHAEGSPVSGEGSPAVALSAQGSEASLEGADEVLELAAKREQEEGGSERGQMGGRDGAQEGIGKEAGEEAREEAGERPEEEVLRELLREVRPCGEDELSLWEAEDVASWAGRHVALVHLRPQLANAEVTGEDLAAATADWAREVLGLHDERDVQRLLQARDVLISGSFDF